MSRSGVPEGTIQRRGLVAGAAAALALVQLSGTSNRADPHDPSATAAREQAEDEHLVQPLRQVNAGVLNIEYAEAGPPDGPAVILLHGSPYDIHTYVDVAPLLASAGYRAVVPYLRGYGATRFLANETPRNGQQSVVAVDVIAFMDALKIEKAVVAGCDWGARTANIVAALWPERCMALVSVSGYLIGSQEANRMPLPPNSRMTPLSSAAPRPSIIRITSTS